MPNNSYLAKRSDIHLPRRFWHITCGVIGLSLFYYLEYDLIFWGYVCGFIALLGFYGDKKRLQNEKLNSWLTRYFGPLMRRSEKYSFSGLPFYALGSAVTIFFYQESIAIISLLFLIFADPVASIVGVYYGTERLLPNKSLQGTIACFLTCFICAVYFCIMTNNQDPQVLMFCFLSAIIGAISELLGAFNIDDNLLIPVVSGGGMTLLNYSLSLF